jgi:transcriptional regulator with XRE-family HTH domain
MASLVGVSQQNIAFWELSEKPPRSDVLPKIAEVLGVSVEELLNAKTVTKKQTGPKGRLRQLFEETSKLPRRQ